MSKHVLDKMTKEDKARDYDRIYRALVEATHEMGLQSCEMEKLRRKLGEPKPPKRYVSVTVEARALAEDIFKEPPRTYADLNDRIDTWGILDFLADNGDFFDVRWDAKYEEEDEED